MTWVVVRLEGASWWSGGSDRRCDHRQGDHLQTADGPDARLVLTPGPDRDAGGLRREPDSSPCRASCDARPRSPIHLVRRVPVSADRGSDGRGRSDRADARRCRARAARVRWRPAERQPLAVPADRRRTVLVNHLVGAVDVTSALFWTTMAAADAELVSLWLAAGLAGGLAGRLFVEPEFWTARFSRYAWIAGTGISEAEVTR